MKLLNETRESACHYTSITPETYVPIKLDEFYQQNLRKVKGHVNSK
jgi:hypothetical protein